MSDWVGRAEALERLGVRAQTLYSYVSRGRIGMQPDPQDPRRSLYATADLDNMIAHRRRGRKAVAIAASALAWGEPSIPTRISTIERGRLIYRGEDAVALSERCSLDDVAALLWEQPGPVRFTSDVPPTAGGSLTVIARLAETSMASLGRSSASLSADGAATIAALVHSFGAVTEDAAPLHTRLATAWSLNGERTDLLRRVLVLLADHDLNASTFAVRVAASTGASIPACLLAGLSTLSGPHHGGAAAALAMLVRQAEQEGPKAALEHWLASGRSLPGFGHPLYPHGDVRAQALLARFDLDPVMAGLADVAGTATDRLPNIDFALVAATRAFGLPQNAPMTLFALARSVGWVAHAIEQITTGTLIRPRGRYEG